MKKATNFLRKAGKFLLFFFLFHAWWILYYPASIINFIVCIFKTEDRGLGYFENSSVNGDKFACRELRTGLNFFFTTKYSYKFGIIRETMSGVFGKNERTQKLYGIPTNPPAAQAVVAFLGILEKRHCEISIDDNVSWELEQLLEEFILKETQRKNDC